MPYENGGNTNTNPTGPTTEPVHHSIQTVFSIETYDVTKKFDRWLMRLESAFKVFAIPENMKAPYLLHYIGPNAYDDTPDSKTYTELVNTMKEHYNPEPLEIAEIFRFLQRKQQEGESVKEYITVLQRLATTCNFGEYQRKALRNQFVFGLRNENIQSRLLEYKNLTLERAVEVATSMETSARDAAQLHKSHTYTQNVNKLSSNQKKYKDSSSSGTQMTFTHKNSAFTNNTMF